MSDSALAENSGHDTQVTPPVRKTSRKSSIKEASQIAPVQVGSIKKSGLKKLDVDTVKLLTQLRERANRKEFGRKVRDNEIIYLALTLLEAKHIEDLKDQTYSEQDRLRFAHLEYQKAHGRISLDQFIGKLIRGEIQTLVKA